MNMEGKRIHTESFKVHTYEVDPHNILTIDSLCQFIQEAASNHADTLGFGVNYLLSNNRTWVLSRLSVKIDRKITLGDTIHLKTWPSGSEKFFFTRDFIIESNTGNELGRGASYWLFIDTEKRRPVPPSRGEIVFDFKELPSGIDKPLEKLPQIDSISSPELSFTVRYGDLDLNNHVNNIAYIRWALEGIDPEFRKLHYASSIDINFIAEAVYGEKVSLSTNAVSGKAFLHYLFKGETEICRLRTSWKEQRPS